MKKKALFLAHALSGYFLACLKKFAGEYDVEVHVIKYPVAEIAPFKFEMQSENIFFYERKNYDRKSLDQLVNIIHPEIIFCSGWADKDYLHICQAALKAVRVVLLFDNPWRATLKQNIMVFTGKHFLKKHFSSCWVSGFPQRIYALKLGFSDHEICEGCYSCDFDFFYGEYLKNRAAKSKSFPRKLLFVGRYAALKGVEELWDAFIKFSGKSNNDWELWCIGKGDLKSKMPSHPRIKDFGFVQPEEIGRYIQQTGIFILPAHYEHWGVVVHEFASAGFPLICSSTTSAATAFLKAGYNGWIHAPRNAESIYGTLDEISGYSDRELFEMSEKSTNLARQITPVVWSKTASSYLNDELLPVFRFDKESVSLQTHEITEK